MAKKKASSGFAAGKSLIRIFTVLGVLAALGLFFLAAPFFNVQNLNISGANRVTREQIKLAGIDTGGNFFLLSTGKAKRLLSEIPYVKSVNLTKTFPDSVNLEIRERIPRAYIEYENMGLYLMVDEDGYVLDVHNSLYEKLPMISGIEFDKLVKGEPLETKDNKVFSCMVDMSRLFVKYQIQDIASIDMSDIEDIHIYIREVDVSFGSVDNGEEKVRTMKAVLAELPAEIVGYLDVASSDKQAVFSHRK